MHERFNGFLEAVTGSFVASLPWWAKTLDQIIVGAHLVASVGGAVIAIHGVYRIIRGRSPNRSTDPL